MTEDTFGFGEMDHVPIVHADEIGMNQSSVSAFADHGDERMVSVMALPLIREAERDPGSHALTAVAGRNTA